MKLISLLAIVLSLSISSIKIQAQDLTNQFAKNTIQIGVVVEDMDQAMDFYKNVLGMVERPGFSVNTDIAKRSGLSNGVPFDVKIMKLEDSDEAQQWKVISFGQKANHPKPKYMSDDTGMRFCTLFVKSMKPFLERIKKQHVELLGETPIALSGGRQLVLIQDPDGNFFELIGPE